MDKLQDQKLPWKNEIEFYNLHSEEIFSNFPFYHVAMVGKTKEEFLNHIIERAKIYPNAKVVDLGCGGGYLVNSLSEFCDGVGISTSEACIKQAKTNYPNANFKVGNMETYSSKNATHFLALESMGYSDAEKTFKNVYNNLQRNGIFYIKEWYKRFNESGKEKENRECWENYFKYKVYNILEIIQLGYEAGFTLLSLDELTNKMNGDMYLESIKHHKVEFKLPHESIDFVDPVELLFIKK